MLDGLETVQIVCGELRTGRKRDNMLDGEETVQIACGKLRWEGARQHAGRTGNGGNIREDFRWEGARKHAGRTGNRANSLRKSSLGGSETACWTERKPCK